MAQMASEGRKWGRLRVAGWAMAAALWLLPLAAMQFTDEVNWDVFDFAVFGSMLIGAGVVCELAVWTTRSTAYRSAVGVAVVAAFLLVWINLAVGIIGSEHNPANLMYGGVLAIAIIGSVISRFKPSGMARALSATAVAQALVGITALAFGLGSQTPSVPQAIVLSTGFFTLLWLLSAFLFLKATHIPTSGVAP